MSNYNQIFHENLVFFENMNLSYDLYESIDLMLEELSGIFIVSNDEINKEDLTELFRAIYDDAFLKKNIIGIEIISDGSLKMYNRNFDYQIDFGKLKDIERKFKNYKAFFQKAVLDSSLYKYKKIDLRFTEQVVCTK